MIFLVAISAKTVPFFRKIFLLDIKRKKNIEVSESEDNKIYQTSLENKDLVNKPIPISEVLNSDIEDETDMAESEGCTDKTDHHEENFFEIVPKQEETLVKEDTIQEDRSGEPEFVIEENIQEEEETSNSEELGEYDPTLDLSRYKAPSFDLLNKYEGSDRQIDMDEQNANKNRIIETLENYGIRISSIKATVGPTITLYEIVPEPGVRISKIRNLEDDIALSLAALGIRIIAPIPGKGTIGIEVPNKDPQIVSMYSVIASKKFQECKFDLPVALGKTITNEIFMVDLAKMPHILVAGATGQGKSVGLNAIITSLLY